MGTMLNTNLKKIVYRQDHILQLPFPDSPSLANVITNGVLKRDEAAQFDESNRRYSEAVQNIIKLTLKLPDITAWQKKIEAELAKDEAELAELKASLDALTKQVGPAVVDLTALIARVTALESSVANLNTLFAIQEIQISSMIVSIGNLTIQVNTILSNAAPLQHFNRDPRDVPVIAPTVTGSTLAPLWGIWDLPPNATSGLYLWNGTEWVG